MSEFGCTTLTITKFVEFLTDKLLTKIKESYVYFQPSQVTQIPHKQYALFPIFIRIKSDNNRYCYRNHKQILEMFDGEPVIMFTESKKRKALTDADPDVIQCLKITHELSDYKGYTFYPSEILACTNETNNTRMLKQIINFSTHIEFGDKDDKNKAEDEEIPDDAF